jgi:hypothetical protein
MKKIVIVGVVFLFVGMGFQPAFAYDITMVDDSTPSDTWYSLNSLKEEWNQTFGGYYDDWGYCVQQTTDGGYIITGGTSSYGDIDGDFFLIKTDSNGNKTWHKTFGDISYDKGFSVTQTSDGGYIITGITFPIVGVGNVGLIKTDSNGNKTWFKTFDGGGLDGGRSVSESSDGGYILTGYSSSSFPGFADVWLIKTDSNGKKIWDNKYGGTVYDCGMFVDQTIDGCYIIIGVTESYGAGSKDVWLIKTGSNGNKMWDKTFGGTSDDGGYSVSQTSDGGYIITGYTRSFGAGGDDVWLIKTDGSGNRVWDKTFGGTSDDGGYSVSQTSDGGYIITGYTRSFGAGSRDVWLIKTDSTGNMTWDRTFGGPDYDDAWCVQQTTDDGYIITGWTNSFGAGNDDVWLIKIRAENQPPSAPTIDGPPDGKPGVEYSFTFHSYDENGDMVRYHIEWGDGSSEVTDWIQACTPVTVYNTYNAKGTYTITAYAEDESGAVSPSSTFTIIIPRSKAVTSNMLLLRLLERFSLLQRLYDVWRSFTI